MFCPKCGMQIEEGGRFCPKCGANLSEYYEEENETTSDTGEMPQGIGENDPGTAEGPDPATDVVAARKVVKPKRKRAPLGIIGIVLLLLVAAGAFLLLRNNIGTAGGDEAYLMLSDDSYELLKNLKKDSAIELGSPRSTNHYSELAGFSPDGKYVYFFTKIDEGSGTLNRAEIGKLKKDSSKNEKYIETIGSNVNPGIKFFPSGVVVYRNNNNNLYFYDGKEATLIAKDVADFYLDEGTKMVYSVTNYSSDDEFESYALYGFDTKDPDDKVKIATDVSNYTIRDDINNIVFFKQDEDYNSTLYEAGYDKEPKKLRSDVVMLENAEGTLIYLSETGNKLLLYDLVNDDGSDEWGSARDYLKNEDYAFNLRDLYVCKNGEETKLASDVIYADARGGVAFFITKDTFESKIPIAKMYDPLDDFDLPEEAINLEKSCIINTANPDVVIKLSSKAVDELTGNDNNLEIFLGTCFRNIGGKLFAFGENGSLYEATVENNEISQLKLIDDDAHEMGIYKTTLYYTSNEYSNNDNWYYDVYALTDGETTKIAQDVTRDGMTHYEDGSLLAYTDYRYYSDGMKGDLVFFDGKGEKKTIGNDVSQYLRLDKNRILFISDDNLYLYDGKEKEMVKSDVDRVWCSVYMKDSGAFNLYSYNPYY